MTVLLSAPSLPPSVPTEPWPGCSQTWTGWDGSLWQISGDPSSGVRLKEGVRGLAMPQWQRYSTLSPAVPGSRHRGSVASDREVLWPLGVYNDVGSAEWIAYDRAFWRTMHPDRPGLWRFTSPTGQTRSLPCRFVTDGQHTFRTDPSRMGWQLYAVALLADEPFWQGEPIVRSFKAAAPAPFFGAGAPSFAISSGSTLANATIDNPGDEPSFPVWTLEGPFTSATVGVDGRSIVVPFALAAGQSLVIDPRPTEQTAIDQAGVERTGQLGAVDFAAVPPGVSVPLTLSMVGTGTVTAELTPLYFRAW